MDDVENKNKNYLIDVYGEKIVVEHKNKSQIVKAFRVIYSLLTVATLKRSFEWSKENTSDALILISGVGAIIQIYELARINISYLRFFSVTQLISDGAVVLLMVVYIAIVWAISTVIIVRTDIHEDLKADIEKNERFTLYHKYWRYLAIVICTFVSIGASNDVRYFNIGENIFFAMGILGAALAYIRYSTMYYKIFGVYLETTNDTFMLFGRCNFKFLYKIFNKGMELTSKIAMVVIIANAMIMFPAASRLPYNLENYEQISEKMEERYGNINYYKLLYFNDTYAFIEMKKTKDSKNKILVYKTDDLIY